ncbi:MAG: hypothetical protein Q9160_001332 [Pyrenula sp. 1 TL-2023]
MSRSTTDPTRFTSTQPSASSYSSYQSQSANPSSFTSSRPLPTSHASTPNSNSNAPPNETPKEKVARLRAQSRLAKARASSSPLERFISRSRGWADISHRIFAVGLIGFSGVAGVFAIYSIGSLITHNRRQKRAWIEREIERLHDAQRAFLRGEASPEQLHLLEQERAGEEMKIKREEELRERRDNGVLGRTKRALGIEAKKEEGREYALLDDMREVGVVRGRSGDVGSGFEEGDREAERVFGTSGAVAERGGEGQLDVLADNAASKVIPSTDKGWLSWMRWR